MQSRGICMGGFGRLSSPPEDSIHIPKIICALSTYQRPLDKLKHTSSCCDTVVARKSSRSLRELLWGQYDGEPAAVGAALGDPWGRGWVYFGKKTLEVGRYCGAC
jgi:hypothetical protein